MEDDDASVRVVADERGIPPSVGDSFDERTHIVITIRLCWRYKHGIECKEWVRRYYFIAELNR